MKNKIFLITKEIYENNMSSLNINDLYESMYNKNLNRYQKFDDILKCIHNRIKFNAKYERTFCFYQIPIFIIGVPLYNINDLTNYLINSLKKNGFQLMYFDPNILFITWEIKKPKLCSSNEIKKNNDKNKNKNKNKNNEFKLIDNYKPKGDFIYNQIDLNSMRDKSNDLIKNSK